MMLSKFVSTVALSAALGAAGLAMAKGPASFNVSYAPDTLSLGVYADVENFKTMSVKVMGPDGMVLNTYSTTGLVDLGAKGLLDGQYRYEVRVLVNDSTAEDGGVRVLERKSSTFKVQGGQIQVPPTGLKSSDRDSLPENDLSLMDTIGNEALKLVGTLLEAVVPTADAVDLVASSTVPTLTYNDTSEAGNDWQAFAGNAGVTDPFYIIRDLKNTLTDPFRINSSANNDKSFLVDTAGDIGLADNSVFIDRSADRMGIGTAAPTDQLHLVSSNPTIRLEDPETPGSYAELNGLGQSNYFDIRMYDGTNPITTPVFIYDDAATNALVLRGNNVGMGDSSPNASLEVERNDGTAQILVTETNGVNAARTLFQLVNNGSTKFGVLNSSTGLEWSFNHGNNGTFKISRQDTALAEMVLNPGGNMTISGVLTQGSDVNSKTNIREVDSAEILSRVQSMPITKWQYKSAVGVDHIGPMAQDFSAAFGLGEKSTTIATLDTSGVALVAVKELATRYDALSADYRELKAAFEEQQRQLQAQDDRVAQMETDRARLEVLEKVMVEVLKSSAGQTQHASFK